MNVRVGSHTLECYRMNYNDMHDQDACETRSVMNRLLVAVADGASDTPYGGDASILATAMAVSVFTEKFESNELPTEGSARERCDNEPTFYEYLDTLKLRIKGLPDQLRARDADGPARTTLTVVLFEGSSGRPLTAHYAAWGDSPIVIAYPGPTMGGLKRAHLVMQVQGGPVMIQSEGRLYSFLDAAGGSAEGRESVGSFVLHPKDVCLVMTDGVPWQEYIVGEIVDGRLSQQFLESISSKGKNVQKAVYAFEQRLKRDGALHDDATMVVVTVDAR